MVLGEIDRNYEVEYTGIVDPYNDVLAVVSLFSQYPFYPYSHIKRYVENCCLAQGMCRVVIFVIKRNY